jgi:microsomal dipeptidase-like Zn-dependent dipeptidase
VSIWLFPDHCTTYRQNRKDFSEMGSSAATNASPSSPFRRQGPPPHPSAATIDDVVANIDHVAKVAGIDHVGIGTDFDGIGNDVPKGLEDASKMPALAVALRKKGYSEADVEKVMGGNFLRVMKQVIGK